MRHGNGAGAPRLDATILPRVTRTVLCALLYATSACQSREPEASAGPPPAPVASAQRYGAGVGPGTVTPLARVLAAPTEFADKTVVVEATVRRACTRKGCWMELAETEEAKDQGCRVTFKDYGFFVPTDSAGARARVEGTVLAKQVHASEVAHLEQEGARFATKRPDGSATEIRIVATGVELRR